MKTHVHVYVTHTSVYVQPPLTMASWKLPEQTQDQKTLLVHPSAPATLSSYDDCLHAHHCIGTYMHKYNIYICIEYNWLPCAHAQGVKSTKMIRFCRSVICDDKKNCRFSYVVITWLHVHFYNVQSILVDSNHCLLFNFLGREKKKNMLLGDIPSPFYMYGK